jgi:hypothetical protein
MSKFNTPRVVTTIAQSRLDYNLSTTSLLQNFSGSTAPIPADISLEGATGLRTGMFWYKSGGNSSLGQNRFLVYDGSSFTRNGIGTFRMSSISEANTAATAGNIEYGDLVLVGTDELYLVNSAGTGINRIGESATTLAGLTSTQFLRSDIDTTATANLILNSNNFVKIPIGSTAQRPQGTSARPGHIRYNTDLKQFEGYNETSWGTLGGVEALANTSNFAANVIFASNDGKTLYVNSSFRFNPSTNTLTAGIFTGNLNGAAVVANTVNVATTSAAIAFKVPFANTTVSTTGNYNLLQDSEATFTYNPSTNTLTAGIFSGNLNGAANIANTVNVATSSAASAFKVPFANTTASATGNYNLLQDSEATFTYNPSTNTLTAGIFSGNLNGASVVANTVNVATSSASSNFKVSFVNTTASATGNYTLLQDSEATFTYNPSTNTLTAGIFSGNLNGAPNVAVANTDNEFKVLFANTTANTTGNYNLLQDSETTFTYNPSTSTLTAGNFNSTSDIRVKENIRIIPDALEKLDILSGYLFNFIGQPSDSAGLLAQELQEVLPQCVTEVNGILHVNYSGALALLLQGFKEYRNYMDNNIEYLESRLDER